MIFIGDKSQRLFLPSFLLKEILYFNENNSKDKGVAFSHLCLHIFLNSTCIPGLEPCFRDWHLQQVHCDVTGNKTFS